ncbi:hypothetical protein GCM10022234_08800 [Aeromicrobium panaciterrae]|uniref:hypothetical protein n=1 Tax=Aeromicrobium panaciterrae TaxID=363861 RepID=UPI0031E205DB
MIVAGLAQHGIGGGATDLPIPLMFAMVGASWALALSFAMLVVQWKEPRFTRSDVEPHATEPRPRRTWLAIVGAVLTGWFLVALYLGPSDETNSGLGWFYILTWVGLVPIALLFGHVWRDLSPWRTIQSWLGDGRRTYPARLGYWPAALGLLAFAWMELASPDPADLTTVRVWIGVYVAAMLLGGWVFGPTWFDRADPFDVYSAIVAKLSPFVRDGRFGLHNPLRSLPTIPVAPGLVAVLATLLGSTAYDSFSASTSWQAKSLSPWQHSATLFGFCLLVGVLFALATRASGGLTAERRRALPGELAHTLTPIVVGYIFAHYATYLFEKGQSAFIAMFDPLGRGWEPLGDPATNYFLSQHVDLLAFLKVGFVVTGHVLAVIAAHDRALAVLPRAHRLSGQLALLVLMVAYTFTGLYLLFSA